MTAASCSLSLVHVVHVQVCNHRFHGECIKHWGDTSCPVCRYCMLSSNASTSRCSTCGTSTNLWICLICGHVGCGRSVHRLAPLLVSTERTCRAACIPVVLACMLLSKWS
jgi:hypothetical protein